MATSLARLYRGRGKREDARKLLAGVFDWFTEGFNTPDLCDARALGRAVHVGTSFLDVRIRAPAAPTSDRIGRGDAAMDSAMVERVRAAAKSVFRTAPVLAAYAYGSRVSGRPRPNSDLDVGYYLKGYRERETLSLRDELRLASALSDAIRLDVDLRNLAEAPLELRGRALEEGVRIYSADDAARVALERYLLARYHDYKDTFRRMHELRLRRLAERAF